MDLSSRSPHRGMEPIQMHGRYTHPYSNVWAFAGVVGVSRWLGYPQTTENVASTTVIATENTATETESVLAGSPSKEVPADLEWMALGVYAAALEEHNRPTHLFNSMLVAMEL